MPIRIRLNDAAGPTGSGSTALAGTTVNVAVSFQNECCVLQVFLLRNDSRLLVCTPSNSSADLIAERLILSKR
jgi:hypothetical protein